MHWHFHFDGKQIFRDETITTKIEIATANSQHQQQTSSSLSLSASYSDCCYDNHYASDSSSDIDVGVVGSGGNSRSISSIHNRPDDTARKKERFFNRKSSSVRSRKKSIVKESRSNNKIIDDEGVIKHKLFHIHMPWRHNNNNNNNHNNDSNNNNNNNNLFDSYDSETTHVETDQHTTDESDHYNNELEEESLSTTKTTTTTSPMTKTVSFSTIQIREYELILGDHPYCSNGVPTCLGWDHIELDAIDIDRYEHVRGPRRKSAAKQFRISAIARKDLLVRSENNDYTKADFRRAERKLYKDRRRKDTKKFFNMT